MGTNRTKIDWAYKQAVAICIEVATAASADRQDVIRHVAGRLRRVHRKGEKLAMQKYSLAPGLTVATIRECKKQLEAGYRIVSDHVRSIPDSVDRELTR